MYCLSRKSIIYLCRKINHLNFKEMNKADLINAIAKEAEVTKVQAGTALDTILTAIEKSLKKGESVILVGFGTFSTAERKARTGRNPATGKAIKIPKRRVVRFKAGKGLSDAVKK